jgi:ketosteroid isomerase-like protein
MAHPEPFDAAIEASHHALDEITRGNPNPFFELYSDREDATLANPYGPPARGRREIERAAQRAASNYRDGKAIEFENFATFVTADLGYMLEIERFQAKVAGGEDVIPSPCGSPASSGLKTEHGSSSIGMPIRSRPHNRLSR